MKFFGPTRYITIFRRSISSNLTAKKSTKIKSLTDKIYYNFSAGVSNECGYTENLEERSQKIIR